MRRVTALMLVGAFVATILLTACGPRGTPTQRSSLFITPPASGGQTPGGGESPEEGEPTVEGQEAGGGGPLTDQIPGDVPIMDGAYRIQFARAGSQITYEVDGEIASIVEYYQTELDALGWQLTRSPDTVVGAIASMARTNEAGDRLTINMQFNPNGNFVIVTLSILRSGQ